MIVESSLKIPQEALPLVGEAQASLTQGDTTRAAELYAKAGKIILDDIPNFSDQKDKHLLRFLAASQYYHGGHYQRAEQLTRKIQKTLLPEKARPLFNQFKKDVKERSSSDYESKIQKKIQDVKDKNYSKVLDILTEHPYAMSRQILARIRYACCENLHDFQAAAIFCADACRFDPENAELVYIPMRFVLTNLDTDRLDDAWKYAQYQMDYISQPASYVGAALVCFHKAALSMATEHFEAWTKRQLEYSDRANELFEDSPNSEKKSHFLRQLMALSFESAALASQKLGQGRKAREFANKAVEFAPLSASAYSQRGIITYPSEQAINDFHRAAELDDQSYIPDVYFAHEAFTSNDFQNAVEWCEKALAKKPIPKVQAELMEWSAISHVYLGTDLEKIEALFDEALNLDPNNQRILKNARIFDESENGKTAPHEWLRDETLSSQEFGQRQIDLHLREFTENSNADGALVAI